MVEYLRTIAEVIIWGDKHEPAIFEYFLEKNMLSIFWQILAQELTPPSVKQQLLQTLSMLIQNIEAGPSVYFILSNNHINELIAHPYAPALTCHQPRLSGTHPPRDMVLRTLISLELGPACAGST